MKYFEDFDIFSNVPQYDVKTIYTDLQNILEEMGSAWSSYSDLVRHGNDMEEDWTEISDALIEQGYNLEELKIIINNANLNNSRFTDTNGMTDLFVYKMTEDKGYLSGFDIRQSADYSPEDYLIKYEYGWTKNDYGLILINYYYESVDNFFEAFFNDVKPKAVKYLVANEEISEEEAEKRFKIDGKSMEISTKYPAGLRERLIKNADIDESSNHFKIEISTNLIELKFL